MVVEGEEPEYHVEDVEDSREFRGSLEYRVHWVSWPSLTWEPWYFVNTTEAVTSFHRRYPGKQGPMPEGSEVAELQRRGLNISGFAGAHPLGGGYWHGPSLDDDKAPARMLSPLPASTAASTLATSTCATIPTAIPIDTPARLLWDVQHEERSAEGRSETTGQRQGFT